MLACLAVVGAAGLGGMAAGVTARPDHAPRAATMMTAEISPAETVNLRFPADWGETAAVAAAPVVLAFASADGAFSLFSPEPLYPLMEAKSEAPDPQPPAQPRSAAAAPAKVTLASAFARPSPARRSNAVLNDSQIAGIRKRLNLTPEQERYWPAVEVELRKMEYKRDGRSHGGRMAQVDVSKVDVEGLKSAGFPLVMSFNDDQRRELKSLAHLLGLEGVMSGL